MRFLENLNNYNASVILSLALILFTGFLMTRITKKLKLPDVTGYLFAGIIIGPYVLNLIPAYVLSGMDFIPTLRPHTLPSVWENISNWIP